MTYQVVGLDLSLTGTGVARLRPETGEIHLRTISSAKVPNAKYPETLTRIRGLARRIIDATVEGLEEGDILVVAIEGPILGQTAGIAHAHTRAGLWWLVYHLLEKRGLMVVIEPSRLKRYVTGKGNADKTAMTSAITRSFPSLLVTNDNEVDGLGLASMVARELGFPMEPSVQRVTPSALEGIDWPEHITQRRTALNG